MNLTFRQYQAKLIQDCALECQVSKAEASTCFPDHIVRARHGEACFRAAQEGIILSKYVLDSLLPLQRHHIFHDLPDYLTLWFKSTGKAYIDPENRIEEDSYMKYLATLARKTVRNNRKK